jgi:outer membrane protein assembly factor BamB
MKNEKRKMKDAEWGMCVVALLALCSLAAGPATRPADFAAFRDGGGLTGVAADQLPPPPMKLRWTYHTTEDPQQHASVESAAAISGETVYVADGRGTLHAIDLASGKGKWKYASDGGFETSPMVMGGRVYLGDLAGIVHCVSAADGKKLWTFDSENGIHSSCNSDGSHVLFGNDGAQILCLDTEGKKLWSVEAGDRINAAPALVNLPGDKLAALFSGCDANLRAIGLSDGKEIFAADMGFLAPGSAAVAGDRIVAGTDRGHVLCFGLDGKLLWDFDKVADEAMVYASPAVSDGIVVAGARDRKVYGLDLKTGNQLWSFTTRGDVDSSPLISAGRVYVGSKDRKLYVLDLKTGQKLWEFTASRPISAPPAIAHGVLVIGDEKGNVYCFEAK